MSVLGWIVVGLIAGSLAQAATGDVKRGCLGTLAVGVVGGLIGGALFQVFDQEGIDHFSLWSILVAFVGSVVLLVGLRLLTGSGRT